MAVRSQSRGGQAPKIAAEVVVEEEEEEEESSGKQCTFLDQELDRQDACSIPW